LYRKLPFFSDRKTFRSTECGWHLWVNTCRFYLNCGNSIYDDLRLTTGIGLLNNACIGHYQSCQLLNKQCDRWSDLMPVISWELWLARDIVNDYPLPWQKAMTQLTPGRVAQAMPGILMRVSTPAQAPKPRGKSSGWKTGEKRQRRIRYPIVKKRTSPSPKTAQKSA
ncbi:MAG: hypothetical protein RMY63_30710, partial [Nostoc sp. ChiQUE01b]|nr:hypothetical protein [Nostoc sp. ChiQUE01b]